MNYVFTQKELSYLDSLLPDKQTAKKKKKLTLHEIDMEVLERARKDQNAIIKRESVRTGSIVTRVKRKVEDDTKDAAGKKEKATSSSATIDVPKISDDEDEKEFI